MFHRTNLIAAVTATLLASSAFAQIQPGQGAHNLTHLMYSFGPAPAAGFTPVAATDAYTKDKGFGFDLGSQVTANAGSVIGKDGNPTRTPPSLTAAWPPPPPSSTVCTTCTSPASTAAS